ncbi:hypothetical protein ACFX2F_039555 [Malus domestica]
MKKTEYLNSFKPEKRREKNRKRERDWVLVEYSYMACQSSTIWGAKTESASKISSCFNNSSSVLLFSSAIRNKSRRFLTCSLDPISTSSTTSSSSASQKTTCKNITNRKSLEVQRTKDGASSVLHGDERRQSDKKIKKSKKDETKNGEIMRSKSGSRKRPSSWQKVFFSSKKFRSIMLLNFITIVYASDIPVIKEVEAFMDPAAFSAVRFVMSAIPFLPFVFRSRGDVQTRNSGMELGFWISLGYLLEALGLLTSDAGRASFISLFTVITVPLLDGMLGATIPARTWFGVLMSALGIAMLECSGSPPNVGDLLNFLSAIFFGIHMIRTEHISRSTKKENFLAILGFEVCVVAMLSTIWVFIGGWFDGTNYSNQSPWTWTELWDWLVVFPWIPAIYTGAFSTGLCLWIEIAAMSDVSATETAIIYGMEPLWGAGFAWFLLGERWGMLGWLGAALVLGGSLLVQIFGSSSPKEFTVAKDGNEKGDLDLQRVPVEHKLQNGLSTSPVVVRSEKNVTDFFK